MNITERPNFNGGLETICRARTFLKLMEADGGTTAETFYQKISAPTSPYPQMIGFLHDKVSKLDASKPEVAKIQAIWSQLHAKPTTAQQLWNCKTELESWLNAYQTSEQVQLIPSLHPSLQARFSQTPLIFVTGTCDSSEPNAISINQHAEALDLLNKFLNIIICETEDITIVVLNQLSQLLALKEGRKLLEEIIKVAGDKKITFKWGPLFIAHLGTLTIELEKQAITCVYECPNRQVQGSYQLKSLQTPYMLTFAHELLHILHTLQQLPGQPYPKNSHMAQLYTTHEEERTIRGSANAPISENSIGDSINMYPRYGHIPGNGTNCDAEGAIDHANSFGIHSDLDWIIPSINPPANLEKIYKKNHELIKKDLSEKTYEKVKKKLKRKLVKEVKKSSTKKTKEPKHKGGAGPSSAAIAHFPLSKSDVVHNRTLLMERIQAHMVQNELDTSTLLPTTPFTIQN